MNFILRFRLPVLTALAVTQIFSSIWFIPGGEGIGGSVFRMLLLLLAGALALTTGLRHVSASTLRGLLAGVLLLGWMTLSLTWSEDIAGGLRQLTYLATTVTLIYVLEVLVRGPRDFSFLAAVIMLLSIGIIVFAFYELQTGNHFHSAILEVDDYDASLSYITWDMAWFTFGNPNDLVVHLILSCFVSALYFSGITRRSLLVIAFTSVCVYLGERLQARLAIASIVAFVAVYFVCFVHKRAAFGRLAAGVASAVGTLVVLVALVMIDRAEFIDLSSFIRLQLLAAAIEMSTRSYFAGIGVGSFEIHVALEGLTSRTYGVLSPHNAFGRVLAENGVMGLALLGYLIFGPLSALRRSVRTTRLSAFVAASTVALPLLLSAGSDPMSASTLGFFIAIMWVAARMASSAGGTLAQKALAEPSDSGIQAPLERAL